MSVEMTPAQQSAVEAIRNWHQDTRGSKVFTLFGYAGTGKTTVVAKAVSEMGLRAVYAAYTGKAASVMRAQGIPAQTIHSMIYHAVKSHLTQDVRFEWNPDSVASCADLIVIDECSMVGDKVARDLLRYGKKVLALGDPAQLPPVKDGGYFSKFTPDLQLTDVHRQAEDSPVLKLATAARLGENIPYGKHGTSEVVGARDLDDDIWSADQVLVGTNRSRSSLNRRARNFFGMGGPYPQLGEKVICLRNNYRFNMMNGEMFIVVSCAELPGNCLRMDLVREDGGGETLTGVLCRADCFTGPTSEAALVSAVYSHLVQMDYGYAITVHKSQGSQWKNVVLFDESRFFREDSQKWLYTGITRASERITIARGRL